MTPHVFPICKILLRRGPSTTFIGFPTVVGKNVMPLHHRRLKLPLDHCRIPGVVEIEVEAQKVVVVVDVPAFVVAVVVILPLGLLGNNCSIPKLRDASSCRLTSPSTAPSPTSPANTTGRVIR
jgi:hypothetical protein